jgi:surface antigen
MRKTSVLASMAVCLLFATVAAPAQSDNGPPPPQGYNNGAPQGDEAGPPPGPPGPDPYGYYSQYDRDGYYDRDGHYIRYQDQRYDQGPPPPDASYEEQRYEENCERSNNTAGTFFGAIAGGLIGGAASHGNGGAVVGGAILGGLFGNAVTRDMPCADHPYAFRVYAAGLDGNIGQRYEWRHGDDYGYFIPQREFHRGGTVCRSFTETTYADGHSYTRSGTACRQTDGNWHFDN